MFAKLTLLLSLIFGLCGMSWATLFGTPPTTPTSVFQTEPWINPGLCSTDWYPQNRHDADLPTYTTLLKDYAAQFPFELTLENLQFSHSWWGPCQQTEPPQLQMLEMAWRLNAPTHDTVLIGGVIRQILAVLAADPHLTNAVSHIQLINIRVHTPSQVYVWIFPYEQAQAAIAAGVNDQQLWELGEPWIYDRR